MFAVASPDGRFLASFDDYGPIQLIDGATLQHLVTLPTPGRVQPPPEVQFSRDGDRVVAIEAKTVPDATRRAWIWEVPSGRLLVEFHPPPGRRTASVSIHPGRHSSPRPPLWKAVSRDRTCGTCRNQHIVQNGLPHSRRITPGAEDSADGRLLAKSEPGRIVVHDTLTGEEKHSLGQGTRDGLEWRLSFSGDGQTLMATSRTRVEFWDLARGNLAASRRLDGSINLDRTWAIPDGHTLVIRKPEGILGFWNRKTGLTRTIRPDAVPGRHDFSVQFSADGRKLAILRRVGDQTGGRFTSGTSARPRWRQRARWMG